jgi:phage terminase large subunit GpA-like protein
VTAVELLTGHQTARTLERKSRRLHYAPPPRLTLSEWADRFRMLSSEGSAEPGHWRTARAPYLKDIMDACTDPSVEEVVFAKATQLGWTEVLLNVVGYYICQDPSPIMLTQPNLDLAKMWSRERLDPMIRDTPALHGKIREGNRREKDQSILKKSFPGGLLAIQGATSASGLRARPIRIYCADERDAYLASARGAARGGKQATGEGDPFLLAKKRTTNFWNRKILQGSTMTVKGLSPTEADYEDSTQGKFYVPCPHCGYAQLLLWRGIKWESGQPETAGYLCGEFSQDGEIVQGCGTIIEEHHKTGMLTAGVWKHAHPERHRKGFWLNALYSPWVKWSEHVREFLQAKGKPEAMVIFTNTVLAETYEDTGERVNESLLEARRGLGGYSDKTPPEFEVPMRAAVLVAGVDVQGDRLECSVWAYGAGEESWLIDHIQLWGSPAETEVWRQLDAVLARPFRHESKQVLTIRCMAIDIGGHHSDETYRYCKARRRRSVWPVKGVGGEGLAAVRPPAAKSRAKDKLWTVGSNAMKDTLFARLKIETDGPQYLHFAKHIPAEYFKQLTSERRVTTYLKGKPTRGYVGIEGRRHEALDCAQYALAALYILGPVRDRLHLEVKRLEALANPAEPAASPAQPVSILPQLRANRPQPRRGGWATNY